MSNASPADTFGYEDEVFDNSLPEGWHPCVVHRSTLHPDAVKKLNEAEKLLKNRQQIVEKSDRFIDKAAKLLMTIGGVGTALFAPVLTIPVLVAGAAIRFANQHIAEKGYCRFTQAHKALDICRDYDVPVSEKGEALYALYKAAHHVHYWENTRSVVTTVTKFGIAELALPFAASMTFMDAKEGFSTRHKQKTSDRLFEALEVVREHLGPELELPHSKRYGSPGFKKP